jgi:hypothetical protein
MSEATKTEDDSHETEKAPGVALAGDPETDHNDRKPTYREQRHELFGGQSDERVPSGSWREVYHAMGVRQP